MNRKMDVSRLTTLLGKDEEEWNTRVADDMDDMRASFSGLYKTVRSSGSMREFLAGLGRAVNDMLVTACDTVLLRRLRAKARAAQRRERRRAARQQKRYRHRMRKAIFSSLAAKLLIYTAVYWGIGIFLLSSPDLLNALRITAADILGISYFDLPDPAYFFAAGILVYIITIFIWPMTALRNTAGYLDNILLATDNLLDKDEDIPRLPPKINEFDIKLREVRLSILRSEQLAKESEQRKNDLVVYLAHDLKTPLSSVIGYLSLLEELPELPTEQRAKYTSIALDKAYRLEQLINEFFEITRFNLQSVELQNNRIDLALMLRQIADEFYPVFEEKGLRIRLDTEPRLNMTGDADKLMRVFDNLLRNAVSYSYPNTQIDIQAYRAEDAIEVAVSNTGDEIPPQSLERLFEKFYRADSSRTSSTGGSGLGLAIAKHIIELHGGQITAHSSPVRTKFMISLPNVRNS